MDRMTERARPAIDLIFAVILLIATLSTAFCVYQATRWNGFQAIDFGESSQLLTESIRATSTADSQLVIDVQMFTSWVNAVIKGDRVQAAFLKERFRGEFRPAFDAWIAGANTSANPIPAGTSFDRPEYALSKYHESAALEELATAAFDRGVDANTNGDQYISNTVLFAIVLFFCGVYSRWESIRIRAALLVVTLFILSGAIASLGSLLLRVGYV
jgi:hypothetical protein